MTLPLYVLLPDGVEWTSVPGTSAQRPAPIRWYLRQSMPTATTQTAVLVEEGDGISERVALVARTAIELGGITVDAGTQEIVDPEDAGIPTP
jgi:hypothetical protein